MFGTGLIEKLQKQDQHRINPHPRKTGPGRKHEQGPRDKDGKPYVRSPMAMAFNSYATRYTHALSNYVAEQNLRRMAQKAAKKQTQF
jgi:hypothetical protein